MVEKIKEEHSTNEERTSLVYMPRYIAEGKYRGRLQLSVWRKVTLLETKGCYKANSFLT